MLKSIEFGALDEAATTPTHVAVVGLGYWGPNLIRVLTEQRGCRLCLDLRPRARHGSPRYERRYPSARPDEALRATC